MAGKRNLPIPQPTILDGYDYMKNRFLNFWNKNGGQICSVAGTTGLFLTGLHASRKTYNNHDKLKANGEAMRKAREYIDGEKKLHRWLRILKTDSKYALKTAKDYLPDIVGGSLSAYVTQKGWSIEHKHFQHAATGMALMAADFMAYRQNVIDDLGMDADRRYLTTRKENRKIHEATMEDGTKLEAVKNDKGETEGITVSVDQNMFKILYSKATTPRVWSESHALRLINLESIVADLNRQLIYGGQYTVNDVRREFFGPKGDLGAGGMFGRVWDPGNPEHPERGAMVNLHYEDDQDFMDGLKDHCWIYIDVDTDPLFEILDQVKSDDPRFTQVEDV